MLRISFRFVVPLVHHVLRPQRYGTFGAPTECDVCIIGSGSNGCALACALQQGQLTSQLRTVIIDKGSVIAAPPVGQPPLRTVSITPRSQRFLNAIDVWARLKSPHAVTKIDVREGQPSHCLGVQGALEFTSSNLETSSGAPHLAHIVSTDELTHVLGQQAAASDKVQMLSHCTITGMKSGLSGVTVLYDAESADGKQLRESRILRATMVVAADGAQSSVRSQLAIPTIQRSYGQNAVVCTAEIAATENDVAYQNFFEDGDIIAYLPLSPTLTNIVYSTNTDNAKQLMVDFKEDPELFQEHINFKLKANNNVPYLQKVLNAGSFPLHLIWATTAVKDRVALLGDAAHSIHPLAGQGLNLGFYDAIVLTNVLHDALEAGADIGSQAILAEYNLRMKRHTVQMIGGQEMTKIGYQFRSPAIAAIRSGVLSIMNGIPPLKSVMMAFASGEHVEHLKTTVRQ